MSDETDLDSFTFGELETTRTPSYYEDYPAGLEIQ